MMWNKEIGVLFLVVFSLHTAKASELEIVEAQEDIDYEAMNATDYDQINGTNTIMAGDRRWQPLEKRICKVFQSKTWFKNWGKDIEDLKDSLRRNIKIFDDAIRIACQKLTWDGETSTEKRRLCLREGFDGKSDDKVCRVFGGEPTSNGRNVQELCAKINIQNGRITNQTKSLKWTAKSFCLKNKYGWNTKEGRLCRIL